MSNEEPLNRATKVTRRMIEMEYATGWFWKSWHDIVSKS